MSSVQIGPFMFATGLLLAVLGFITANIVAAVLDRKHKSGAENTVFWGVLWGVIAGRLAYVVSHLSLYQGAWTAALDLRDGDINIAAALVVAGLYYLFRWYKNRRLWPALPAAVVSGLLVAAVLHLLLGSGDTVRGKALPPLTLQALEPVDTHRSLADFTGQPVVLNLWASWCGPCRREMPAFAQAQAMNPDITFIFLNQGESAQTANDFLKQEGLSLEHVYLDPQQQALASVGSAGLPTTVFIDASGNVIDLRAGELSLPSLRAYLERLRKP